MRPSRRRITGRPSKFYKEGIMSKTIPKADTALLFDHGKIASEAQKEVQEAMDRLVDTGAERGLQVAVYRGADLVVDAVAGIADPGKGRRGAPGTPLYKFSGGQGGGSTPVHVLAPRGLLRYHPPGVELWAGVWAP